MGVAGKVIAGSFDRVLVRQKAGVSLEIGQLLTARAEEGSVLLQVTDIMYGSQLSQQSLELVSGMKLESSNDLELFDADLRTYSLASLKPLLLLTDGGSRVCKSLPTFFSEVYELEAGSFLPRPAEPLLIGNLRSGSRALSDVVYLDGHLVFSHHVLIAAQTGRGKSNLMRSLLYSALERSYAGFLILDPHDEHYGRTRLGLKESGRAVYYTPNNPPATARSLVINISKIKPSHFNGVAYWSDAQREALYAFYKKYGDAWISRLLMEDDPQIQSLFHKDTIMVIRRRLMNLLSLDVSDEGIVSHGIFDAVAGSGTVSDIIQDLEEAKAVIIDTSSLPGSLEILVGSIIASDLFARYQHYKLTGELSAKPVVSVVLEEAPRVLGSDVLEQGPNVFSRIAREGRKFKVGITAITQLPSLIPRPILANLSTKIILGIEMAPERKAIIESAAQDLSQDDRAIASLDRGEAIVTSTFSQFAIPVRIPFFDDVVKKSRPQHVQAFPGLKDV